MFARLRVAVDLAIEQPLFVATAPVRIPSTICVLADEAIAYQPNAIAGQHPVLTARGVSNDGEARRAADGRCSRPRRLDLLDSAPRRRNRNVTDHTLYYISANAADR
jgi:hypothetical protein